MKKVFALMLCLCAIATTNGQNSQRRNKIYTVTDSDPITVAKRDYTAVKSIVYNVGFGMPFISSDLLAGDHWNKNSGFAFQLGADFRKQFTTERILNDRVVNYPTSFAVGAGLGISSFSTSAEFENFSEQVTGLTDIDGHTFNADLSSRNVKEQLSLMYLDIPVYLEIGKPSKTKTKAWAKIGVKGSLLLSDNFKGEGQYTSKGFYPAWNVTLHDIPDLNYNTNKQCYENPEYKLNPFILWGNLSAGLSVPLSSPEKDVLRNTILKIGLKYDFTLTTISEGSANDLFPGSSYRINQSNMLGGKGAGLQYLGLEIGLIYSL
jgi:hypothetical protein